MDMKALMAQMMISISEVMETMFYLPVEQRDIESIETSGFLDAEEIQACKITFAGSFSGRIYLLLPAPLLLIMTENFMGESPEHLTAEYLSGTLQETLNMLAGNTFSKIDPTSSFSLGVPEISETFIDEICSPDTHSVKTDSAKTDSSTKQNSSARKNYSENSIIIDTMDGPMAVSVQLD